MSRSRPPIGFIVIVALQIAFILSWAGYHEWVRRTAPVISLKVLPVDPRDIVRGQYFTLSYEISSVPAPADFKPTVGTTVWVALREENGFAHATGVFRDRASAAEISALVARGTVGSRSTPATLRVRYGIEDYYVPEGTPTPPRTSDLVVKATVSPEGKLNIKHVLLDGRTFP